MRSRRSRQPGRGSAPLTKAERGILGRLKNAGLTRAAADTPRKRAYFRREVVTRPAVGSYLRGETKRQKITSSKQRETARARGYEIRKGSVFVPQKPGMRTELSKAGKEISRGAGRERIRDLVGLAEARTMSAREQAVIERRLNPDEAIAAQVGGPQGPLVMPPQATVAGAVGRFNYPASRVPVAQTRLVAVRRSYLERVEGERTGRRERERARAREGMRRLREERRSAFRVRR